MLIAKLRYQGLFIAGLFVLLMLGSFVPDPFSHPVETRSASTNVFKPIQDYVRFRMKYAAFAPLVRGIVGYNLNSSLTSRVYISRNHHLYFAEDNATAQSFGDIYRQPEVARFADIAAVLKRELRKEGSDLIVAIAPNAQSIAIEDMPFRPSEDVPREYDLALHELKKRAIGTSDIRSVFLAHGDGKALYGSTETHWNYLGALLAFNSVVTDAGYPQWALPTSVLGPPSPVLGGDLSRFLGIQYYVRDMAPSVAIPIDGSWEKVSIMRSPPFLKVFDSHTYDRKGASERVGAEGARVLVLGDSFTQGFWLPFWKNTAAIDRIGWLHHAQCNFDFNDVRLFKPTLVIWVPTERYVPCSLEQWPIGLPKE
ncbi:MAG TPA: hypothetical protein VGC86_02180 [Afipia sp.]